MTAAPVLVETTTPWLGSIPTHWKLSRFGYEATLNGGQVDPREEPWASTILVAPNHIESDTGRLLGRQTSAEQGADSGKYIAYRGQILYSKIRPALNKATIAVEDCLCSADMYAMSFRPPTDTRYALYQILARPFHTFATVTSQRVKMPKINREELAAVPWLMPPPAEQRAIADFLDRETARIDTLIAKQERLIETLRERRRAEISHVLGQGMRPQSAMRDSGAAWLGEVPEHWTTLRIKWLTPVRRGASPRPIDDPIYFDDAGEWSWVRISDVTSAGPAGLLSATTQRLSELGASLSVQLHPGSLFVSIAGTVGKPCITQIPCCIHDGFVYFPDLQIDPLWLFRIFESGECYAGLGKLGTQLNLNTDTIGSIVVPIPPDDEIVEILAHVNERASEIDTLIAKAEQFIALSKERRSALITVAVTGQISVLDKVA